MKIFIEKIYNIECKFSELYTIKEALRKYLGYHVDTDNYELQKSVQELIDQIDESLKD